MASTGSKVRPYCGKEPYIFISYAHRNETEVYRIIERMQAEGYRVWYDRGVDPGTEWADNIAERVSSCDYFIAYITQEYLDSTNCLDELSFARDKEKKRLLVYLSNVTLPDGIRMRSNRLQAIHKYGYEQEEEFYEKLFQTRGIGNCMVPPEHESESTADLNVPNFYQGSEEKVSAPLPDRLAEKEQEVTEQQPVTMQLEIESGTEPEIVRSGNGKKLFIAIVGIFLVALAFFLFKNRGMNDGKQSGMDTANSAPSVVILDQNDLGGLVFGMSREEIREILTAAGARESSAAYDAKGLLMVEYAYTDTHYGKEVEGLINAKTFQGREITGFIAGFGVDGLYQVYYALDAHQDPDGKGLLKALSNKYGKPTAQYDTYYQWDMDGDIAFHYFPPSDMEEDGVLISLPDESYFNMRSFSWGMTPDEAQKAEAARNLPLTLTKSSVNSEGYPYQFYEGEWEVHGSSVNLVTLNFVEDQLVEMKYILSDVSFDQVIADCTTLYGEGGDMAGDGSAIAWQVWMYNPDISSSVLIAFSAVKSESGVRMTFRDWEKYQTLVQN